MPPLSLPRTLTLATLGASLAGCPQPSATDAGLDADVAIDDAADRCTTATYADGAVLYVACPLPNGCEQVTYPDGYSIVGLC